MSHPTTYYHHPIPEVQSTDAASSSLPRHNSSPHPNPNNIPTRHHPTLPQERTPMSMYEHHHQHHQHQLYGRREINNCSAISASGPASGLPQRILPRQQLPSFGVFLNRHLSSPNNANAHSTHSTTGKTSDVSMGVHQISSGAPHSQPTLGGGYHHQHPPLHSEPHAVVHRPHAAQPHVNHPPAGVPDEGSENKRRERWTDEEHELFLDGLETFGRKWKKIQTYVRSKTSVQVRTHAYGYFAKLLRNMPEHVRFLETSANDEFSTVENLMSENARHEVREEGRRGLEILNKFVLSKRKPALSVEEKRQQLGLGKSSNNLSLTNVPTSTPARSTTTTTAAQHLNVPTNPNRMMHPQPPRQHTGIESPGPPNPNQLT